MQSEVFQKFTSASNYTKLHENSFDYFLIMKRSIKECQERRTFDGTHAICNLHSCYMKNALVISQSESHNFFSCTLLSNYIFSNIFLSDRPALPVGYGGKQDPSQKYLQYPRYENFECSYPGDIFA